MAAAAGCNMEVQYWDNNYGNAIPLWSKADVLSCNAAVDLHYNLLADGRLK